MSAIAAEKSIDTAPRRIILCADDFGMSPGVNRAILTLVKMRRVNATSVMAVAPAFDHEYANALQRAANDNSCQIGLHVTLTAPFRPLTTQFDPVDNDRFPTLSRLLSASLSRWLDRDLLRVEIIAQLEAFEAMFGCAPNY